MGAAGDSFPIVGVGASAGGLEALRAVFGGASGATGMAFVVVQHLDPTHESLMAQLIERYTAMPVKQASGDETVEADHVYVIPPGHGLALESGVLKLTEFTDPRGMRRPIDDFFESLAEDAGTRAACVILSGTGADGSRGLRAIKEHGGLCIAQEPESAAYDGMPGSAISTGLVDIVAAPREVIGALRNFFARASGGAPTDEAREVTDHIDDLCDVLREAVGHDFSLYKRSTLTRRIARRMQLLGIEGAAEYLERLRGDAEECQALFRDLLINVTRFFRDPEHFEALDRLVIDPLVANCPTGAELRFWVAGCSSGEEAYSLAMLVADAAERHGTRPYVQIFATDIDEKMLDIARAGAYPLSALGDIPRPLRDRYTVGGSDKFIVANAIRDMVRFSMHNVVRDPPFSKVDLICCRNLLIYFNEELQRQVVPIFHFALAEGGYMFLGSSEAVGRYEDLFEVVDQGARIFRRRNVTGRYSLQISPPTPRLRAPHRARVEQERPRVNGTEIAALNLVADRYAPVSLLVDAEGLLLERWGAAGRYLDFPDRLERTVHVPSLARPGLRELIGPLIRQVSDTGRRAGATGVEIRTAFGTLEARVICERLDEGAFLFVIEETGPLAVSEDDFDEFDMEDGQRQFLEEELQATRHRLRSTVEELETTNEELKSSNEEMMSMNEELQSTNEELTTVNDELKNKVDQLTVANADLRNFFDSTQIAVLVVDGDLRLRSFTEAALELFPIDNNDIGKPLADLASRLDGQSHVALARKARDGETQEERIRAEATDADIIARAIPYTRGDGSIDGATLIFTDVTQALSLERDLNEERERLRLALEVAGIGVWEYQPATDRVVLDATARRLLVIGDDEAGDRMEPILTAMEDGDRARVNQALRKAMDGESDFDETFRVAGEEGETRWLHGLGRMMDGSAKRKLIGVMFDVTAERALLAQRELMIREMNHRVKNLFSVISAMISIAARESRDIDAFAEDLRGRIHALGRSHALTSRIESGMSAGGAIPLRQLVETVIRPSRSSQAITVEGSEVEVPNSQITSIALILHEWATNAAKYGVLANEAAKNGGRLAVDWAEKDGRIELTWVESGHAPEGGDDDDDGGAGFGTRLVETAARQLHGEIAGERRPDGFARRLAFPLA
ncbi:PAS domain-containing protein [Tsuneonella sp. YG55]|uniref:PAS domain-containing protein n=1 Tax=Tsuneonella litorea TaxID=2976475 RepID=A0A9X3AL32_9SPHN|nr:CheR family methyltransferase [Tsuneonella litorea]MCT2559174.1 PAS domain-containing protein [Tsuneonella litorea]